MHDPIKDFHLDGEMKDTNIVQTKENLISVVEGRMRDKGYVPVLDLDPQFSLSYVPEKQKYKFRLTIYGAYVGEEACKISGVANGKTILKHTPKNKSSQP